MKSWTLTLAEIPKFRFCTNYVIELKSTSLGTYLMMPPDRRLFPSGAAGAPTAPARARTPRRRSLPTEERAGWRVTRCGTDAHAGGRRAARLCRRLMAAGSPAPSRPEWRRRRSAPNLVLRMLIRQPRPPRRDEARGRASRFVAGAGRLLPLSRWRPLPLSLRH
jgi:hypothetical protein